MNASAALMCKNNKDKQDPKADRRYDEEIGDD